MATNVCPQCGRVNGVRSRFCAQCGAALAATPVVAPVAVAVPPPPAAGGAAQGGVLNGRYLVLRPLKQGGMGALYLAQDQNAFNRRCVIKEMLPYYNTSAEKAKAEKDFEREARVLAGLRTEGVPQVFEYFIHGSNYCLVMEYIEGENLEERMARLGGSLPLDEALAYGLQLANILVYLGKQSPPVIHRDIKPANIIMDTHQNRIKLVDFGLAKQSVAGSATSALSTPLGTPGYAPLEQYSNATESRSDVYSLGATLHHCISGRDPRNGTAFDFPPLASLMPGCPPRVADLIQQMLQSRVAERPSASQVRDELEAIVTPAGPVVPRALPFSLRSGAIAHDPAQLALLCDKQWEDGVYHLFEGHLEAWLENIGRHDLAVRAQSIRLRGGNRSIGLEEFLRAANPTMALPVLALSDNVLDFGSLEKGRTVTIRFRAKNVGRGCLFGRMSALQSWGTVRPLEFSAMPNDEVEFALTLVTSQLGEGRLDTPIVQVNSNGGDSSLLCRGEVIWPPALEVDTLRRLFFGGLPGAPALAVARMPGQSRGATVLLPESDPDAQPEPLKSTLTIRNSGGGTLEGRVICEGGWLSSQPESFAIGTGASLAITILALAPPGQLKATGVVRVETAQGAEEVPALLDLRPLLYTAEQRRRSWVQYGGALAAGGIGLVSVLATLVSLALGAAGSGWGWSTLFWIAAGCAGIGAAVWAVQRFGAAIDAMEEYLHHQPFDTLVSRSWGSSRKFVVLLAGAVLFGALLGRSFAESSSSPPAGWMVLGAIFAALAMAALLADRDPPLALPQSPAWLAAFWRGQSLESSVAAALLRLIVLVASGAALGVLAVGMMPFPGWLGSVLGAALGLLLGGSGLTVLTPRLRGALDDVRYALAPILLAWAALSLAYLVRYNLAVPFPSGYGGLDWTLAGWGTVAIAAFYLLLGLAGAVAGLYVVEGPAHPFVRSLRPFLSLTVLAIIVTLPVYILASLLTGFLAGLLPSRAGSWTAALLALAIVAAAIGLGIWYLFRRRKKVEALSALLVSRGAAVLPGIRQQAVQRLGGWQSRASQWRQQPWLQRAGLQLRQTIVRLRLPKRLTSPLSTVTLPTLREIETQTPLRLAMAAGVTALFLQPTAARLVVWLGLGLGVAALGLALLVLLSVGGFYLVQRLRARP